MSLTKVAYLTHKFTSNILLNGKSTSMKNSDACKFAIDSLEKGAVFFFIHCHFMTIVESFYTFNYVNVNYSIKYSTVDSKFLLFYQIFFLRLKPKH